MMSMGQTQGDRFKTVIVFVALAGLVAAMVDDERAEFLEKG